jgi:NADPH:quinone reductase-like Zn-dependent oxidoreductase
MFAAYVERFDPESPEDALVLGDRPEPDVPPGWTVVQVRAASLNRHDAWSLAGVGLDAAALPMILGCDAAGIAEDGSEVVVHSVVPDPTRGDLGFSLLSERYPGTFAQRVAVPRENLLPKPPELSFVEAACLPTAWLTAYRMLFTASGAQPGATVLVQGAGGGVATALVALGRAAGYRVWVTTRDEAKGERAVRLGADAWFPSGGRLPERVDAVLETVGAATWEHSIKSLRPGGTVVVSGSTSGYVARTELARVFYRELRIVGSTMGTRDELQRLGAFCVVTGVRPVVDRVLPLAEARAAVAAMLHGDLFGKIVLQP